MVRDGRYCIRGGTRLTDLREKFKNATVLVVGDVMLDRYWWGNVSRISPEAPVPVIDLRSTSSMPGGAANVAVNVAALGSDVRLVSAIGNDAEGEELISELSHRGLSVEGILQVADRRTSVKTRIIAHSQQVARVDNEQVDALSEESSAQIAELIRTVARECSAVILSDYAKGTLTRAVIAGAVNAAGEYSAPILVDPKGKDYEKYKGATVLTPNRREAAEACKLEETDPHVVTKAGHTLISELDLDHLLITEGEHGMTLFSRSENGSFHLDASVHQVYDVTGAGDSVIACLGVALAAGLPMQEACRLANAAGAVSVQRIGTHAVTFDELWSELDTDAAMI